MKLRFKLYLYSSGKVNKIIYGGLGVVVAR